MNKLTASLILTLWASIAYAQQDMFIYKKKNRTLAIFKKDSYIAFQLKSGAWYAGDITKVQNDSFTIHRWWCAMVYLSGWGQWASTK